MIAEPKLGPLGARETTRLPFTGGKKEWMESPVPTSSDDRLSGPAALVVVNDYRTPIALR